MQLLDSIFVGAGVLSWEGRLKDNNGTTLVTSHSATNRIMARGPPVVGWLWDEQNLTF